ncbi:Homogentisate 1,2-dioxygenase [Paraburkholderia ribeironis]|uniref:Homogentisate 1,2-dioxygenase n=1 Tax=Paraburkholderia ribeironis TaxID=1247936 RepID=A0A1N7RZT5_9BURK|nr:homogentisate 1,2-dioxygenase [Paraburkholderia ribeironis]SIT40583.1 Homogentisate 1,2-dioxygenase [Paraburkholderia ribeironis]
MNQTGTNAVRDNRNYMHGFGHQFESEAVAGTLPTGMNSPRQLSHGLYAEQLSGTAFTSVRSENRRTWLYRKRPSINEVEQQHHENTRWLTAPLASGVLDPRTLRWRPMALRGEQDFVTSMCTVGANGSAPDQVGCAVHIYHASQSMEGTAFCNSDGELLIVPQQGGLDIQTELGWLTIHPGEFAVIPRGLCFRVILLEATARGYVLENYGPMLRLPELGPIGSNGLANPRDFQCPVAAFDAEDSDCLIITKFGGRFWSRKMPCTPFNVVAWHGNLVPFKYDIERFNVFGSVSYDSPDPSISTILTSPSSQPGTAYIDFVAFPTRWQVAENTFRPPFFHRNVMTEFMGLVYGIYEGKTDGFMPGGFSLHSCMAPHGPDRNTFLNGTNEPSVPNKLTGTMAFMFETKLPLYLNPEVLVWPELDGNYTNCWKGFEPAQI